jgi:hypothetical protein
MDKPSRETAGMAFEISRDLCDRSWALMLPAREKAG